MNAGHLARSMGVALAIGTSVIASAAQAVPYELPNDGYYQLQDASTFQTLCQTGRGPCDVDPGRYLLLDFRFQPARLRDVTVAAKGNGNGTDRFSPSSFARVDRTCSFGAGGESLRAAGSFGNGTASCRVSCPAPTPRLYGVVTCSGGVQDSGRGSLDPLSTSFQSDQYGNVPDSVSCSTDETASFIQPSPVAGNYLLVGAMCGPR